MIAIAETNLNDVWSRRAAAMCEPEPERAAVRPARRSNSNGAPSAGAQHAEDVPLSMRIAGLTREAIQRYVVKNVGTTDKRGDHAASLGGVVSLWIQITPEMASRWLKANFRNRPVSDDVVAAYARDMAANRWQPTHQGIAFNDQDQLIDGQHRLLAVIKSKKTVRMMVTFGLRSQIEGSEMTTMDCVDRGRTRSVAHQLKIQHGLKAGSKIAQIAAVIAHLCVGERIRRLSVGQTLDIYRAYQPAVDFVIAKRSKEPGLKSAGVLGAFAFFIGQMSDGTVQFMSLNAGDNLQGPLLKLREFLVSEQMTLLRANLHRGIAELVVWTLNAAVAGADCPSLEMHPTEWINAVAYVRSKQPERVAKIAALFSI